MASPAFYGIWHYVWNPPPSLSQPLSRNAVASAASCCWISARCCLLPPPQPPALLTLAHRADLVTLCEVPRLRAPGRTCPFGHRHPPDRPVHGHVLRRIRGRWTVRHRILPCTGPPLPPLFAIDERRSSSTAVEEVEGGRKQQAVEGVAPPSALMLGVRVQGQDYSEASGNAGLTMMLSGFAALVMAHAHTATSFMPPAADVMGPTYILALFAGVCGGAAGLRSRICSDEPCAYCGSLPPGAGAAASLILSLCLAHPVQEMKRTRATHRPFLATSLLLPCHGLISCVRRRSAGCTPGC